MQGFRLPTACLAITPLLFLLGFYLFLVGSKVFLAIVVGKSRAFLTKRGYVWTMRVLGCLLGAFALFLLKMRKRALTSIRSLVL